MRNYTMVNFPTVMCDITDILFHGYNIKNIIHCPQHAQTTAYPLNMHNVVYRGN